jgi:FtsP/CotA-like multicopper oxidase with cupredoxin domain
MNKTGAALLVLSAAALAAFYLFARPRAQPEPQVAAAAAATPAAGPSQAEPPLADVREFTFVIAAGAARGPAHLIVREGERVTLHVRSDAADELHLHGYDISVPLPAGEEVVLKFVASKAGRFELELHRAHRELGALEVHPR